jgi:hypothetical protein
MKKPPRKSPTKAVYDKVDGPVYFAKGGKIYKYANGGTVDGLSPQDQATYDGLDEAGKASFLKTLGITLPTTTASPANSITPNVAAGIGTGVNAVTDIVSENTGNSNPMLKQAGLGAAKGAASGLAFGPWGAAIGGGIGLIGGALAGKKQGEAADAASKVRADAEALAEKQRRDAAAKANMNPWEVGAGMKKGGKVKMADGGGVKKSKKEISDNLLNAGKTIKLVNDSILTPYAIKELKLKEGQPIPSNYTISPEKVNELTKGVPYRQSIKTLYEHAKSLPPTPYTKSIIDIAGVNEDPAVIDSLAWGYRMRNMKTPYYGTPLPTQVIKPAVKPKVIVPVSEDPILGLKGGGKIKGSGTAKSDSIKAKVKAESFIVPEENAEVAEEIREEILGEDGKKKAELKQKGGEDVRLSNGEHMFTPEEVEEIEEEGIDLDELAPNAEDNKKMKKGGKVGEKDIALGINKAQSELESIEEEIAKIEKGSKELDKQIKLPKLKLKREQAAKNVELAQDPNNYEDLGKGLGYSFNPKATSAPVIPTPNIPATKVAANKPVNRGGIAGVTKANLLKTLAPNAAAVVDDGNGIIPEVNPTKENVDIFGGNNTPITEPTPLGVEAAKAKLADPTTTPEEKSKLSAFLKDNASLLPGVAGLGLSAFQVGKGIKQLNSLGARPVDTGVIDADFAASVEQAKNDAKYGIDPRERAIAEGGIENVRRAEVANVVNLAGGSGGTALANIRAGSNVAQNNLGRLSAESERLRLEKQRYANNLIGRKAAMNRNLQRTKFEDSMNAFNTNQQAGSQLLGAGIQNAFGALRYTGEAMNQNKLAKTGAGMSYQTTPMTKKDYLDMYGGNVDAAKSYVKSQSRSWDLLP